MKRQPLGYRIIRTESDRAYAHLAIHLHDKDDYGWRDSGAHFYWQGTLGGQNGWYTFQANLGARSMALFNSGAALLKRANPDDRNDPAAIIAHLEKIGARIVRDDRTRDKYIPLCDVPSADLSRWMDWHKEQCTVDCLAVTQSEAQDAMMLAWAKYTSSQAYYTSQEARLADFQAWLSAGRPVRLDSWVKYPANEVLSVPEALAL